MLPAELFYCSHIFKTHEEARALRIVSTSRYVINKPSSSVDVNAESRPHVLVSISLKPLHAFLSILFLNTTELSFICMAKASTHLRLER